MRHEKLVRDGVPDAIRASGTEPLVTVLSDDAAYDGALRAKLVEEAGEAQRAVSREEVLGEIADLLEVAYALGGLHGIDRDAMERARLDKLARRGGFAERLFLVSDGAE